MKFLKFLFGFGDKYAKRTRDYTKNGLWSRISMLITCAALAVASVLLWKYGVVWAFNENVVIGIVVVLAAISMIPVALGETFTMSTVAIRSFFRGIAWSAIGGIGKAVDGVIEDKREAQQVQDGDNIIEQNNEAGEVLNELDHKAEQKVKKMKSYKIFDLIASILFIGIGVANIAMLIYLISTI